MMIYLFIALWVTLTGGMFYMCRKHNLTAIRDCLKTNVEPYVFSGGIGMVLIGLYGPLT